MNKNLTLGLCVVALVLAGCAAPATVTPLATLAPLPTYTPYPTLAARPTYTQSASQTAVSTVAVTVIVTAEVTRVVDRPVTVTPTNTPLESPTVTQTPSDTPIPSDTPRPTATPSDTPTPNEAKTATAVAFATLTEPRPDGNYLVNVDIAPGIWRNDGSATTDNNCYWKRLTKTNDIIDNDLGAGGGTMFVAATDFEVHMQDCGNWTYIGQ